MSDEGEEFNNNLGEHREETMEPRQELQPLNFLDIPEVPLTDWDTEVTNVLLESVERIGHLEIETEKINEKLSEEVGDLKSDVDEVKSKNVELNRKCEQLEIKNLEFENDEIHQEVVHLTVEVEKLKTENFKLNDKVEEVKSEINKGVGSLNLEVEPIRLELEQLYSNFEALSTEHNKIDKKLDVLRKEVTELRTQITNTFAKPKRATSISTVEWGRSYYEQLDQDSEPHLSLVDINANRRLKKKKSVTFSPSTPIIDKETLGFYSSTDSLRPGFKTNKKQMKGIHPDFRIEVIAEKDNDMEKEKKKKKKKKSCKWICCFSKQVVNESDGDGEN
ncbi:unnamed protein product [Caenorhabditis sp. 36 PRJEB53466]|nr:unnamed protein product [Caenorhabditis sp. 36 PRJEB53466]